MKLARPCPGCEKPITLGRVMLSPTPLHLRCPSCKRQLRVERLTLPAIAIGFLAGTAIASWILSEGRITPAGVARGVVAIVFVELVISLLVLNYGKLSLRPSSDEPRR